MVVCSTYRFYDGNLASRYNDRIEGNRNVKVMIRYKKN